MGGSQERKIQFATAMLALELCYSTVQPCYDWVIQLLQYLPAQYSFFNTTVVNDLPHHFEYPCCGTFFVRGRSIRRRPWQDYEKILKNLAWIAHKEPWMHEQRQVGRILESAWHVIFQGENGNSQKDCTPAGPARSGRLTTRLLRSQLSLRQTSYYLAFWQ